MTNSRNVLLCIDQMDDSLDLLRAVEAALSAELWMDKDVMESIRNVVSRSLRGLDTVRAAINEGRAFGASDAVE